jgi:hypothetical protein
MNDDPPIYKTVTRLLVHDFECEASVISALLGVQPTKTWRTGDRVLPEATNVYRQNGWMKESPVDCRRTTPEESVAALLALFPDLSAFARLPEPSQVELGATLFGYKDRPYFFLPARYLAALGTIGADLDLDVYDLSASESDTEG